MCIFISRNSVSFLGKYPWLFPKPFLGSYIFVNLKTFQRFLATWEWLFRKCRFYLDSNTSCVVFWAWGLYLNHSVGLPSNSKLNEKRSKKQDKCPANRTPGVAEKKGNKKDFNDPHNHDSVITHLEPDILECKVKWALRSITTNKASGGDGIPVELFQILIDDAVKVLHSMGQQIWKTQQWPQDWKRSVFIPISKKRQNQRMTKLPYNCTHLTS